jgi:pimeloyl-ACP methyl ester carboxylesterase
MDALADKGFRVIVPDQRGYNLSDKPKGKANYDIDLLAKDVVGLIDALGYEKVYLAGHDWGAAVAWWVSAHYPERLHKLAILNVPYPTVMFQQVKQGNLKQLLKSWYIFWFQMPAFPDYILAKGSQTKWNMLTQTSHPTTFTPAEIKQYQAAWQQPGVWTATLNWYRAAIPKMMRQPIPTPQSLPVPTLILWGEQDIALTKNLAIASADLCADAHLVFYPNATHWVQHDEATAVSQELSTHFQ